MATLISLCQRKYFKNINNLNLITNSKRFYTNNYNTLLLPLSNKKNENFKKFLYNNFLSSIKSNKKFSTKSQELTIPTKTQSTQSTQLIQSTQFLNNETQFLEEIPVKTQFPLIIKEIKTIKKQLPSLEEIKSNFDIYERMTNLVEELEYILKKESNKLGEEEESKNFIILIYLIL